MTREDRRQFLHFGATSFALALRWIPQWAAFTLAGAAVAVWWVFMPLLRRDFGLARDGERFVGGLRTYPVAVLLLLVLFPLPAAAAGWAVLGVGDAFSNLLGRRYGRHPFLGREDRSLVGTLAFVVTAWPAAWGLAMHVHGPSAADAWLPALIAAVAGAVAELLPLQRWIDDNIPVALAAGAAFHFATM